MDLFRKTFRTKDAKKGNVFLAGASFQQTDDGKIVVCSVTPCSSAAICGRIAIGDFLVGVNGKRLECLTDLSAWIQENDVDPIWIELKHSLTGLSQHIVMIKNFQDVETREIPSEDKSEREDCGIGIELEAEEGSFVVSKLWSGGAAWLVAQSPTKDDTTYQLMPGDSIVAINNKPLQGITKVEATRNLRGQSWTRVWLQVMHDGSLSERILIRSPIIPSAKLPGAIKYRSAAAALPSLPPSYRTGRCGHDRGTPAPSLAGMGLDVLSERTVTASQIRDSPALREVIALLTTEDKWAMAALFCSLLAQARLARQPDPTTIDEDGSAAAASEATEPGEEAQAGGDHREWYVRKAELLVAYLGMAGKHRDFFVGTVVLPDAAGAVRRLADYFRRRSQPAPVPAGAVAPDGDGAVSSDGQSGAGWAECGPAEGKTAVGKIRHTRKKSMTRVATSGGRRRVRSGTTGGGRGRRAGYACSASSTAAAARRRSCGTTRGGVGWRDGWRGWWGCRGRGRRRRRRRSASRCSSPGRPQRASAGRRRRRRRGAGAGGAWVGTLRWVGRRWWAGP
jgi:hypothetical protein